MLTLKAVIYIFKYKLHDSYGIPIQCIYEQGNIFLWNRSSLNYIYENITVILYHK